MIYRVRSGRAGFHGSFCDILFIGDDLFTVTTFSSVIVLVTVPISFWESVSVLDVVISVFSSYSSDFASTTDRLDGLVVVPVGADFLLEGDLLVLRVLDLERPLPLEAERDLDFLAGVFFGDENLFTTFWGTLEAGSHESVSGPCPFHLTKYSFFPLLFLSCRICSAYKKNGSTETEFTQSNK